MNASSLKTTKLLSLLLGRWRRTRSTSQISRIASSLCSGETATASRNSSPFFGNQGGASGGVPQYLSMSGYGMQATSSKLLPRKRPLGSNSPTTVNGMPFRCTVWPRPLASPNSVSRVSLPSTTTFAFVRTSSWVKNRPRAMS